MSERSPERRAAGHSGDLEVRFVAGDTDAFEALFRVWQAEVFRWVLRIVRDRGSAEDVTADAFWRAYRSRARFDASRSFGAWMRRIATNAALDHLRRTRSEVDIRIAPEDIRAADDSANRETRDSVAVAFGRLSVKLRAVATLALIEDRPYAEIADALAISVPTVKVRVFRAIRALRRELERLGVRP
jgi:RNA polymerase sigma-70 factor (ECF subfamily)